jgi:hypothetical protein
MSCDDKNIRKKCLLKSMAFWLGSKQANQSGCVLNKLDSQHNEIVQRNRRAIEALIRICVLCGKQDLPLRGQIENDDSRNSGNFLELLKLLRAQNTDTDELFAKLPRNANYLSHESQNEILGVTNTILTDHIVKDIKHSGMFSIIVDEARDASCTEQMSICIRYVKDGCVQEHFLRFIDVHELNATSLSSTIIDFLRTLGLDLKFCVSQCYDGASVMSGHLNGVQVHVRDSCKSPCLYIHCHAHRLNLVLVDVCSDIMCISDSLALMEAIYCFFSVSTLRHDVFKQVQEHANIPVLLLPQQSDTRWICKQKGIFIFKNRFDYIVLALSHFSTFSNKGKERVEAVGLLHQMKSFSFVFVLYLLDCILPMLTITSKYMQSKDADVTSIMTLVESNVQLLMDMRNDQSHLKLVTEVSEFCKSRDISIVKHSREKQPPRLFRYFVVLSTSGSHGSRDTEVLADSNVPPFRREMFEILDKMTAELRRRFEENKVEIVACSTIHPGSANFLNYTTMMPLAQQYSYLGISLPQLENQLRVVRKMLEDIDNVSSPDDLNTLLLPMKCAFPDLLKFIQLVLTIPVSSAQAERTFSCLKRVKTYLRSTMLQQRLNNLCMLSIERELADSCLLKNLTAVVNKFAETGNRRLNLLL